MDAHAAIQRNFDKVPNLFQLVPSTDAARVCQAQDSVGGGRRRSAHLKSFEVDATGYHYDGCPPALNGGNSFYFPICAQRKPDDPIGARVHLSFQVFREAMRERARPPDACVYLFVWIESLIVVHELRAE